MKRIGSLSMDIQLKSRTFPQQIVAILLLVIGVSTQGIAQDRDKLMGLGGDWKFILGDSKKFSVPQYDDSDWEDIYVPAHWEEEGFRNYDGIAWYRLTFTVKFDLTNNMVLDMGRIDDADEVYVNGKLVGSMGGFPPNYFTAYSYARLYPIPAGLLKKDAKNVVAVRVYDHEGPGGLVSKAPAIYDYKNYTTNSINLFGRWKFKLGDDPSWSGVAIDDTQWENILVPGNWETQGFGEYDGFAWYRKTFKLPENYNTDELMLLLGKIDDIDEVFVNGQLVGSTGQVSRRRFEHEDHQQYRTYSVPSGLLKSGKENIIAVRVYDGTGGGGIYEGPITLLPRSEYRDFWREYKENNNDQSWWSYFLD